MILNNEIVEAWLAHKESNVKRSSLAQYRRISKTIIEIFSKFGITTVDKNTSAMLLKELLKEYSPKTAKHVLSLMNQVLYFAYENNYVTERLKCDIKIPSVKQNKFQILSLREQEIFTGFLLEDIDLSKLGVLLCLYTGLRLGELCGLQWLDIDANNGIIHIKRTVQRISDGKGQTYFSIESPKTLFSEREVPVPQPLLALLLAYESECKETYIATGTQDFIQPRTYQNRLKVYFQKSGLASYHFHTLRHTFASRAIELGFDLKSLSEILGHSSVRFTLDMYVHPSMEQKKTEMERFSRFLRVSENTQN